MNIQPISAIRAARLMLRLVMILALLGVLAGPPRVAHASGPYIVDVNYDSHDSNLSDGTCYDGVGGCSLRAAIEQATHDGVATTITFWSGIAGNTIMLEATYGKISWAGNYITVNGESKNVTISGQNLNAGESVIRIWGSHNILENVSVRQSKWDGVQVGDFGGVGEGNSNMLYHVAIYRSVAAGVYIHGSTSGGNGNTVQSSLIGASSVSDNLCATSISNGYDGIFIDGGADTTVISNNRIVCSGYEGIYILGTGGASNNTQITDNGIGTEGSSFSLGNNSNGIKDEHNSGTLISGNTISGNGAAGVWLYNTSNAVLTNNKIGTNISGMAAIPNGIDGVAITDGATNNTVGGYDALTNRNVISGNSACGVRIRDGATHNLVDYNLIGLNINGTAAVPNGTAGVCIINANNNNIGSSSSGVYQYISGNIREGIYIENSSGSWVGQTTRIGVATDGYTAIGNGLEGVKLDTGVINSAIYPRMVMNNGGAGIAVVGNSSTGNELSPMEVGANNGLPIDLGNDGATNNGTQSPPGPNNWMNYPTITHATGGGITGNTCPGCSVNIYRATGDPRATIGGGVYLTRVTANGTGAFNYSIPSSVSAITMVACDTSYNCSEMSPKYVIYRIFLPLSTRQ
jgi:parallel beta-helix repeat protein